MVSAKAGVMPANAIRRTAAEAPVTNFNPRIPGNPFISLPVRARLNRVASYSESVVPRALVPHAGGSEPRAGQTRWKLLTCGIRATLLIQNGILTAARAGTGLEHEGGAPLKSRQNRNRGIEQRPMPEIAMGAGHNHGPR